jgi:hypothetical protein
MPSDPNHESSPPLVLTPSFSEDNPTEARVGAAMQVLKQRGGAKVAIWIGGMPQRHSGRRPNGIRRTP